MPITPDVDHTQCPFDWQPIRTPAEQAAWTASAEAAQARCIDPSRGGRRPGNPDTERPDFDWDADYAAHWQRRGTDPPLRRPGRGAVPTRPH